MATSGSNSDGLPLLSFLFTAAGGLLIGLGALGTWAVVTFLGSGASSSPAGIPPGGGSSSLAAIDTKGIDTIEGRIALICAVLVLVAIPLMRALSRKGRTVLVVLVIVAGIASVAVALRDVVQSDSRLGTAGADRIAKDIADKTGLPFADLKAQAESLTSVDVKPWLYVTVAGGLLAVAGGALSLAWARREGPTEGLPAEELPPSTDPEGA